MVNPEMVMIGTEDGSETGDAKELREFYNTVMENNPRYVVGTWDECEAIKVFYNTFISTKIGLVNMIQDVAQKQGNINVDVVTKALAESTQRIMGPSYMKAGMGDGGACHPRDNIALRYMANNLNLGYDIFDAVMNAREIQARNMAIEILKYGNKIQFSSDSYKPGVEYVDGSYSLLVQHYVKELGGWIVQDNPSVFVRVHETDNVPENVIVFDPWRTYNGPNHAIYYGNTRQR
jgi:UDPglucose 6-dehydrogenase